MPSSSHQCDIATAKRGPSYLSTHALELKILSNGKLILDRYFNKQNLIQFCVAPWQHNKYKCEIELSSITIIDFLLFWNSHYDIRIIIRCHVVHFLVHDCFIMTTCKKNIGGFDKTPVKDATQFMPVGKKPIRKDASFTWCRFWLRDWETTHNGSQESDSCVQSQ